MVARLENLGGCTTGQTGANGEAITQPFGGGDLIRHDAQALIVEIATGPAVTGLNFVEHQQPALVVTDLTQGLQVFWLYRVNAAFALDRLKQHRHDAVVGLGNALDRFNRSEERRVGKGWRAVWGRCNAN